MIELPVVVAEIEAVAGHEAALKLSLAKGGKTVYIPREAKPGHWLVDVVGLEAAVKICEHYRVANTGVRLLIPIAKQAMQRRRLYEALEAGSSASKAAEVAGMHERSAFRARRKIRSKDQGELF